jgi:hypothetical protein
MRLTHFVALLAFLPIAAAQDSKPAKTSSAWSVDPRHC